MQKIHKILLHPTYFPTIAQFYLLNKAFCVLEIADNYQKQTYRNRAYIYGANGRQLLTVPILHTGGETGRQLYKEVKIDNATDWRKLHWKTLQTAYRATPFFEYFEDAIVPVYEKKFNFLLDLNLATIEAACVCMKTDIRWEKTTEYKENYPELYDFRTIANAKTPISIKQTPYYQIFSDKHGFIENLSILDLLFHKGNQALTYLESSITLELYEKMVENQTN